MTSLSPQSSSPHDPVLLGKLIQSLSITPGSEIVDGTFGAGGYSRAFLAAGARVYAFDRDPAAIATGAELAGRADGAFRLFSACFSSMQSILEEYGVAQVDNVVLDIGVSSMQLDQAERGFSFREEGPLDMRMSQSGQSAADFLNEADENQIADIIFLYGEERKSRQIARAIVAARPLKTTLDLANIVRKALGHHAGMPKDPSTRTFQAIRIHINQELDELRAAMAAAERILRPGGKLAIVTFHSLEDRLVKQFMKQRSTTKMAVSRHIPITQNNGPLPTFTNLSKAIKPDEEELARNPRSRSAILRVAERTENPAWPFGEFQKGKAA
ncbi:16S rRNA (cytosine(1402)-N(4))-methyltransferase [Sphingorhabdus lutea]|uniref:Ribosomal RNA small subunit methyltransferase H n=1 Tax=Sphingorhabdus lutea TaxID=1913578 RepID=A0A1L3JD15_9SPHN|nr:16S rRNA (cytosine(1402)-N(4))-methyltransferase RsmH [Sphingorhabdus lutea]APG62979.1 16S rRNA (cytosine(1402)-N(4))-methyltransferase [Sphingorhabdus lutea]